jgi:hypothetical protein
MSARRIVMPLAILVTMFGALLRLDAYCGKYGTLDRPGWAFVATHEVAAAARHLRPATVHWARELDPYVGGDPINYLKFAREMATFYQPHVREPLFLGLTRVSLDLLDQQDAAVSLASAVGSTLAIFGTFLLATELASPLAGILAALLVAGEYDLITWSVDGWRDDLFMAAVVFAAWALLRFHRRASFSSALLVGCTAGLACLTRITALSFVLPGLAWIAVAAKASNRRERVTYAAVAAVVMTAIVAPFLISCAIATGDPLYSIDYHTVYYRAAEGMPVGHAMSASAYIREKVAAYPFNTFDIGATGVFVRPFVTKWQGFAVWQAELGTTLRWLALIGLAAMPFFAAGRLLLLILFTSLLPYAFTWNLGDGGAWRFTMHVYPLYLAASTLAIVGAYRLAAAVLSTAPGARRALVRRYVFRAAAVSCCVASASVIYFVLPWFDVREKLMKGESVSVETGERDWPFYRSGWSPLHLAGAIPVRVSSVKRANVSFPLPKKNRYEAILRLDPVAPQMQRTVSVLLNSQLVAVLRLEWDPLRVGSYPVSLPAAWVNSGINTLTIVPDAMVSAKIAGPRFDWIDPSQPIGVRLWYVRLLPDAP